MCCLKDTFVILSFTGGKVVISKVDLCMIDSEILFQSFSNEQINVIYLLSRFRQPLRVWMQVSNVFYSLTQFICKSHRNPGIIPTGQSEDDVIIPSLQPFGHFSEI